MATATAPARQTQHLYEALHMCVSTALISHLPSGAWFVEAIPPLRVETQEQS